MLAFHCCISGDYIFISIWYIVYSICNGKISTWRSLCLCSGLHSLQRVVRTEYIDSLPHPETNLLIALLFYTVCYFRHPFRSLSLVCSMYIAFNVTFFSSLLIVIRLCLLRCVSESERMCVRIGYTISFYSSLSFSIIIIIIHHFLAHSTFIVFHLSRYPTSPSIALSLSPALSISVHRCSPSSSIFAFVMGRW